MRTRLAKVSNNRFAGVGIGAAVTAIINSSSATTVMIVGFVNVGLMSLTPGGRHHHGRQHRHYHFRADHVVAEHKHQHGGGLFRRRRHGTRDQYDGKSGRSKQIGNILIGIGFIFIGLQFMSDAVKVLTADEVIAPKLDALFLSIGNPFLLFLIGVVLTGLLQSSAAITGILIALAGSGLITIEQAMFITMGSNIGTCATSLIASMGTSTNARRAAVIHLLFNVLAAPFSSF